MTVFGDWTEAERLAALHRCCILDTPPEAEFDGLARIASLVCKAPVALVNFLADDRQWFKAEIGLGRRETPAAIAFCAHAILQPDLFVVPDTLEDPRFNTNPLVTEPPFLRFYAGALVLSDDRLPVGTICVLDHKPRHGLTPEEGEVLLILARQVSALLEWRHALTTERGKLPDIQQAEPEGESSPPRRGPAKGPLRATRVGA